MLSFLLSLSLFGTCFLSCRDVSHPGFDQPLIGQLVQFQNQSQRTNWRGHYHFTATTTTTEQDLELYWPATNLTLAQTVQAIPNQPQSVFLDVIPRPGVYNMVLRCHRCTSHSYSPWGCVVKPKHQTICNFNGRDELWLNRPNDQGGPQTVVWQRLEQPGNYEYWIHSLAGDGPILFTLTGHEGPVMGFRWDPPPGSPLWIRLVSMLLDTNGRLEWRLVEAVEDIRWVYQEEPVGLGWYRMGQGWLPDYPGFPSSYLSTWSSEPPPNDDSSDDREGNAYSLISLVLIVVLVLILCLVFIYCAYYCYRTRRHHATYHLHNDEDL